MVDASWALANQGDGRFDRHMLIGATLPQYPAWVGGTALGVAPGRRDRRPGEARAGCALPGVLPRAARAGAAHPDGGGGGAGRRGDRARPHARRAGRGARSSPPARGARGAEARMTDVWITIGVLAVATVMIKAAGTAGRGRARAVGAGDPRDLAAGSGGAGGARGRHLRGRRDLSTRAPAWRRRWRSRCARCWWWSCGGRGAAAGRALGVASAPGRRPGSARVTVRCGMLPPYRRSRFRPGPKRTTVTEREISLLPSRSKRWRNGLRQPARPRDPREHAGARPLGAAQRVTGRRRRSRSAGSSPPPTRSCPRASSRDSRARAPRGRASPPRTARRCDTR